MLKLSIKIQESNAEISNLIMEGIADVLNRTLFACTNPIETAIRGIFSSAINSSDVWNSLKGGKLQAEFGLPDDVSDRLSDILDIWLNSIQVDYNRVSGKNVLKGGIVLNMLETDWEDVLSSSSAYIITRLGDSLPWLEWLLKFGDKIIVKDYNVLMKPSNRSRSGMAVMTKMKYGRWRVPPEFSGTTNNNFVTKILDNIDNEVVRIIEQELTNRLS